MCGVAGVYSPKNNADSQYINLMLAAIAHRGPDGFGIWSDLQNQCCLGHRRLAIVDLSNDGSQPMCSADGRYSLTFNGEIYNFKELREVLISRGKKFLGNSDTEVLAEAFSYWGVEKALGQLIGMFAIGVWDQKERHLILVRDRVGKKPLYYTIQGGEIWFSSEIKAFRSLEKLTLSLNKEALSHYLSLGYVPSPLTIFSEVREVPPGCVLRFDDGLRPLISQYWSFPEEQSVRLDQRSVVGQIDELLNDAVSLRLRADVPVGVFLSGGIDSGLITAIAAQKSSEPIRTFSATFENSSFDESSLARKVANKYGTKHHELKLTPKLDELLPDIARAYDEPFADPSAVPTYAIAREAARHVKVVLNGEGSDEMFGGYRRHQAMSYYSKLLPIINCAPEMVWQRFHELLPMPRRFRDKYAFLHRFLRVFGTSTVERYLSWGPDIFTEKEKSVLWNFQAQQTTGDYLAGQYENLSDLEPMSHFMRLDFLSGMSDCLLVKIDMATMAHGLEGRSPFLDHRLVELAFSLNRKDLFRGNRSKPLLRKLAENYLPNEIVTAPKRGFEIPLIEWTKGPLKEMINDTLNTQSGIVRQLFQYKKVKSLIDGSETMDQERRSKRLWTLFMLSLWERQLS